MKTIENTMYHRVLRVASLVFALILVFESGLLSRSTAELSAGTRAYLATAIGVSAGVEPTELNRYTAVLTQKEHELEAREAALQEREIVIERGTGAIGDSQTTTYILASILFILLVLILLNYALDYLRSREPLKQNSEQPV